MMRRTCIRKIEEFNFGHPALNKEYRVGLTPNRAVTPNSAANAGVKVTKLANGVRVITHDQEGPLSTVGAYIPAGAKYDPLTSPGLAYAMRWTLLTSNLEDSLYQVDRNLRAHGASFTHGEVRKDFVALRIESRNDMWASPVEKLFTGLSAPRFAESDIERFRDTWDNLVEEQRWQFPREYVVDRLESAAYFKEPLGSPRTVTKLNNDACTSEAMIKQWSELYTPDRIVIAGVNVNHNDLVAAYENAPYPHSGEAPHHRDAKKPVLDFSKEGGQFIAGAEEHEFERRAKAMGTKPWMEEEVIAAVGYKSNGRANIKEFAAAKVTQALLDATTQDGLRYHRQETTHGVRSFYRPFASTGLLGFTTRAAPGDITATIIDTHQKLQKLDVAGLEGAKARATVAFYNEELETNKEYADFLGTSLVGNTTNVTSADAIAEAISKVSAADVKKVVDGAMAQKPTLYATGDLLQFPSLRQLGL